MDDLNANAERVMLSRLRLVAWATAGIALVVIVGAASTLAFQYTQVVKAPRPGDAGLVKAVKVDDFLKQLAQAPSVSGATNGKYLAEARQIVECSRDSNAKSALDTAAFTPQLAEVFRLELQRVADSLGEERGTPYVTDAVRFFCAVLNQPAVIAYKKSNSEEQLFDAVINYHLAQWDQLKDEAKRFHQDEPLRGLNATMKDELRIVKALLGTLAALCIAGAMLGLSMVAALYVAMKRMEFKLQGLQRVLDELNTRTLKRATASSPEALPPYPSPASPEAPATAPDGQPG
jgi:hypothetical protein